MTEGHFLLNDEQKMLLRTLVHYHRQGRLSETITPYPTGRPNEFAIHVRGAPSLLLQGLYNMDVLCMAGVVSARWDRMGYARLYRLNAESLAAVDGGFADVHVALSSDGVFDLRTMFYTMSGGELLPENLAAILPFAPDRFSAAERGTWVDALIEALLATIKPRLPRAQRVAYDSAARRLAEQLKTRFGNPASVRALLADLALLGRIDAGHELAQAAWPLVYPLMLLAAVRRAADEERR